MIGNTRITKFQEKLVMLNLKVRNKFFQEQIQSSYESIGELIREDHDASMDISIALRKGTRSCTQHPLRNFVTYNNLSTKFRAFTASLDVVSIPKSIQLALEVPE